MSEPPLLPDRTSDETDTGWGDAAPDEDEELRRLRDERPPHHDRD
jgi:hypothetical protein